MQRDNGKAAECLIETIRGTGETEDDEAKAFVGAVFIVEELRAIRKLLTAPET